MRILFGTNAWSPQTNNVVVTLTNTIRKLERRGHTVRTINPKTFRTIPCPGYPETRLPVFPGGTVAQTVEAFSPDAVYISTEEPLAPAPPSPWAPRGRSFCMRDACLRKRSSMPSWR